MQISSSNKDRRNTLVLRIKRLRIHRFHNLFPAKLKISEYSPKQEDLSKRKASPFPQLIAIPYSQPRKMSEPIPESVPQSQVPRSHQPKKRVASTPSAQQASLLTSLFSKPDREITLPPPPSGGKSSQSLPPPPEIVANVQGSSAGAGSGEFHVYKASRRREYERVKLMEEEVAREEADKGFVVRRDELKRRDAQRTEKRRKKREKTKGRKGGGDRKEGDRESEAEGIEAMELTRGEEDQKRETEMKGVEGAGLIICDDD